MTETSTAKPPLLPQEHVASSQRLRYAHVTGFVAVWMTLGWVFRLDPNSYLLVGVPLVVAFQIFVRKQPLVTLWVRDATKFRLSIGGILLALLFAILPVMSLADEFRSSPWSAHVPEKLWSVCCIFGALGVAFSLLHFTRKTWRSLLFCCATAGVIGCGIMIGGAMLNKHASHLSPAMVWSGLHSFLLYLPICFVLEEVAFRGALDSHVHQPGDPMPWLSATYVSALWGLWHLPGFGRTKPLEILVLVIFLPLLHVFDGIFLSLSWRRSGNLFVSGAVHAFIDGVRNALLR